MTRILPRLFLPALTLLVLRLLLPAGAMAAQPLGDRFQIAQGYSAEDIEKAKKLAEKYLKKKKGGGSTSSESGEGGSEGGGSGEGGGEGGDGESGGESGSTGSGDGGESGSTGSGGSSGGGGSIDAQPMEEPVSGPKKVDPNDLMFAQAHMKLAKRAFGAKNMDKAKSELTQIFDRVSDYAEARFMRAVIAAKEKDFIEAWRNVDVAQKGAPDNPKIKEFVERLQKAYPKPDVLPDAAPASRPAPTFAAEMAADGVEKLFSEKAASGKIAAVGVYDFTETDGKVKAMLKLEGTAAFDAGEVKKALESILGGTVGDPKTASGSQTLEFEIELPGLPLKNPKVQAVSGLAEVLKGISEETDVAIQDSSESDPDAEKHMTGTYTVAAKGIKSLNDFLRKVSPNAVEFSISRFYSTVFANKAIWKGELKIVFLVDK